MAAIFESMKCYGFDAHNETINVIKKYDISIINFLRN